MPLQVTLHSKTPLVDNETLRNLDIGSWEWDLSSDIVMWSENMACFFGIDTTDSTIITTRTHCLSHVHIDDLHIVNKAFNDCVQNKGNIKVEYRVVKSDSQIQWVQNRGCVTLDEFGKPSKMQGVMFDITERKKSEYELIKKHELTTEKNKAKSGFLARMSHEVKNPLNAIMGFSQMLLEENNLSKVQRHGLQHILNASNHIESLVDESLDLARVEAGVVGLEFDTVVLSDAISECIDLVRVTANEHNQTIELDMGDCEKLSIQIDKKRFIQIILNLLSNAVKYNTPQGEVIVHCRLLANEVSISVEDTGIGLTTEQLNNLFQPFQRLGAESGTVPGTGIGLAITRQLVELMNGSINVNSVPGKGSVFTLQFPTQTCNQPQLKT